MTGDAGLRLSSIQSLMTYCTTSGREDISAGSGFKSSDTESIHSAFETNSRTALEHSAISVNVVHAVSTLAQVFSNHDVSTFATQMNLYVVD